MEANLLREGCSGSEGDFGGSGRLSRATGVVVPVVLDNIWYAVFLRAPRALVPPLGDVLALPLYARAMGEKPLKGRDIEGMPNGRWTRGFRGNDSDRIGFEEEGGGDGEFLIVEFYKRSG
jgi:hypothetical protein